MSTDFSESSMDELLHENGSPSQIGDEVQLKLVRPQNSLVAASAGQTLAFDLLTLP